MGVIRINISTLPMSFSNQAKIFRLVLLVALLFSFWIPKAHACTTFFLRNGEQIVVGRNFDLSYGKYLIFANRRNVTKVGLQYPSELISLPTIWTSKYGSITFNMVGSDIPTDGMNETGLVISTLILDNSVYPGGDDLPSILVEQWLHYMLDNFASVEEVIEASSSLKIRINPFINWELHFFITDNSGKCAAIEFIGGEVVITTGAELEKKVLANSSYESSLEYFNNGRNPDLPMTASLNRFYTAVEMTDAYTNEDPIDYSYSIMDATEQYFTQRKIVYDITNMRIYLKSLENEQLRHIDMNTLDFSCREQTLVYEETLTDIGDIRSLFVPLTTEINQTAVESGWNYMGIVYTAEELSNYSRIPETYEIVFASAGNNATLCVDNYEITGNLPTYYAGNWSVESGSGVFDNSSVMNTFIRQLGPGENRIRWTLEGNSRTFYDDILITNNHVEATAGEDVAVCENKFTLSGNEPAANETGNWQIMSGSGTILTSSVYNSVVNELSNGITELQWSISNGDCQAADLLMITYSPVEANAGNDVIICENEHTLNGNEPKAGEQGEWQVISGSGNIQLASDFTTTITELSSGITELQWKVSNSDCEATDLVTINYSLVEAFAGDDITVCENEFTLTGNEPKVNETGNWQVISGSGNIQSVFDYNSTISELSSGVNELQWTISNGDCETSDLLTITYSPIDVSAGDDVIVCEDELILIGNEPKANEEGQWQIISGSGNIQSVTSFNSFIGELSSGVNELQWTISNDDCEASDLLSITYSPVEAVAGEDVTICENEFILAGNKPKLNEQGSWQIISGSGNIQSASSFNALINNLEKGISELQWTISNGSCESSDLVIIINNSVEAFAGSDIEICGTETTLNATNPAPNNGSWKVINGNVQLQNPNLNNSKAEQLEFGENQFEWTVAEPGGCTATDIVIVTNNLVLADAGADESVETNSLYLSANEPVSGTGTWSVLEGEANFSDENDYGTFAYDLKLGLNKLIWEITNKNCSDNDTVEITYDLKNSISSVSEEFSFNIYPNPASQIINFNFISSERRKCNMTIFNMKGQVVYNENREFSNGQSTHSIDISILSRGTYMLLISTSKEKKNMQFLKL